MPIPPPPTTQHSLWLFILGRLYYKRVVRKGGIRRGLEWEINQQYIMVPMNVVYTALEMTKMCNKSLITTQDTEWGTFI